MNLKDMKEEKMGEFDEGKVMGKWYNYITIFKNKGCNKIQICK